MKMKLKIFLIISSLEQAQTWLKKIPRVNGNDGDTNKATKTLVNSIFLSPTTENEVLKIIESLNSNKSSGVDNISSKALKTIARYLSKPLTFLINKSIDSSLFPEHLIYKAGDTNYPSNYGPISLISNIHSHLSYNKPNDD